MEHNILEPMSERPSKTELRTTIDSEILVEPSELK
jgi:hypothetical protein